MNGTLQALLSQTATPRPVVTVSQGGPLIWSGAVGYANLSTSSRFTTNTVSSVGSVTKLFVLTMTPKLAEQGALSLDSPIANYSLSGIPRGGHSDRP
jgi:CubicO group peptidase (beta-lactamase class C family)